MTSAKPFACWSDGNRHTQLQKRLWVRVIKNQIKMKNRTL